MSYQRFQTYNGSMYGDTPEYQGMEYDWEVPNNSVVSSPGGVSSVHHHWTKGMYGRGNTSSDIYAGQGDRYISGEYGNMYQAGQTAAQDQGYYTDAPDYQYWKNETPQQYTLGGEQLSNAFAGAYKGSIERYDPNPKISSEDFELLDANEQKKSPLIDTVKQINITQENVEKAEKAIKNELKISKIPPLFLFLFFILLFLTFHFWANASDAALSQLVYKGKTPPWQQSLLYAIVMSIVFIIIVWLIGIPLVAFE